jgi:hypothetical protein
MRIALLAPIGFALAVSAGCVMDVEDEPETETAESAIMILPVAGTWSYGETSTVSTTCNSSLTQIEDGPFGVSAVLSTSFTVTPNDGTAPFICKSDTTEGFSCPNRASLFFDFRANFDAQVTVRAVASGKFLDSRHARGKQDAVLDCVGTQCNLIGPNPCGFVVNFEVHHL